MLKDKKFNFMILSILGIIFFSAFLQVDHAYGKDIGKVKALIKVKQAIKDTPDSVKAHMKYQDAMINDGWREQMITEYTERLKEKGETPQNLYYVARLNKNIDERSVAYNELVEKYPEFSWGYYGQAYVLWKRGDSEGAKSLFQRVIEMNPKEPSSYIWLAYLYDKENNYDKAVETTTKGTEVAGDDPKLLSYHGTYLRLTGKSNEALDVINKVLGLDPENEMALRQLGFIYTDLNRAEDAIEARKEYLKRWPNYGAIWGQLCQNYFAVYDRTKDVSAVINGEEACRKSVEVSPDDVNPYLMAIDFFYEREWWVHELYYCRKIMNVITDSHPAFEVADHNLSWVSSKRIASSYFTIEVLKPDDYIHTREDLNQREGELLTAEVWDQLAQKDARSIDDNSTILEQFPECAPAYYNRGIARIGKEEGRTDLEKAVSRAPKWARAHGALAVAHILVKDYQAARDSLKRAVELDPENLTIRYHKGLMEMFDETVVKGTVKQLQEITQAVKAGADINLDTFDVMVEPFEGYLRRDPTSPEIEEAFGDIFFSHSNTYYWSAALTHYKKAVELGGDSQSLKQKISQIENENKQKK